MAATFNPQAAADQARNAFPVIVLAAIFVLATAHLAVSDPAPAYNCGDRGVSWRELLYRSVFLPVRDRIRAERPRCRRSHQGRLLVQLA